MAELLQLEFNVPGAQGIYDKVNAALGFDPDSTASYPKGLLSHIVGLGADGASIAVTEVWNSKKDQEAFLADKLGAALAAEEPPRHSLLVVHPARQQPTQLEEMPGGSRAESRSLEARRCPI